MEEEEIWKVWRDNRRKGTAGSLWEVSNFGNIKKNGKAYPPKIRDDGYFMFGVGWCVHRAVAELFVPNIDNKPTTDHIDRDKSNNHYTNLRWATMAEQNKNRRSFKGENNPFYGKKHTEETLKKLSAINKGKPSTFKGRHHTEESKRKLSEAHTGLKFSEESKLKMSESRKGENNGFYGKHHTIETRKKISESLKRKALQKKLKDLSKAC